jgi:hypothetical protein
MNDLPLEILRSIIRVASRANETELPKPELEARNQTEFLNRFSRAARTTRAVCRQWRELTDERSNHTSRVSHMCLELIIRPGSDAGEAEIFPGILKDFQSDLQRTRSLLGVSLEIDRLDIGHPNAEQQQLIVMFFDEVLRLTSCDHDELRSRLVNMGLVVRLNDYDPVADRTVQKIVVHPVSIPSTLQSLYISTSSLNLLGTLFTPNPQLRELKIYLPFEWDPGNRLPTITLDSLVLLDIVAQATKEVANFIQLLECRHLEDLSITVEDFEDEPQGVLGIHKPISLPHLKTLHMDVLRLFSFFALAAIHTPNVLESILISHSATYGIPPEELEQESRNILRPILQKVRSRAIEIASVAQISTFLLGLPMYCDNTTVRNIRLVLDGHQYLFNEAEKEAISTYKAHFPGLRLLAIQVGYKYIDTMTHVLSGISTGPDLCTLHIEVRPLAGNSFYGAEPDESVWDRFVADASSRERYSGVTTLITKAIRPASASNYTERVPLHTRFVPTLFVLAPRVRTLVLKVETIRKPRGLKQFWPLRDLKPAPKGGKKRKVVLPSLEMIILEYQHPVEIDTLERFRLEFERRLPSLTADRVRLGAQAITAVILKCAGEGDILESREYPQPCGIRLRLEAVDGSRFMKGSYCSELDQVRYM